MFSTFEYYRMWIKKYSVQMFILIIKMKRKDELKIMKQKMITLLLIFFKVFQEMYVRKFPHGLQYLFS